MKNISRRVDKVPDIDEYTSTHLCRRKLPLKIRLSRRLNGRISDDVFVTVLGFYIKKKV